MTKTRRRLALIVAFVVGFVTGSADASQTSAPTWDCQYERAVFASQQEHDIDVLLVGSSLVLRGVHARPLSLASGIPEETILNLGMPSTGIRLHSWLTTDVYLRLLDPEVIVVGVSARDLNVTGLSVRRAEARMAYGALPGFVDSGDLETALKDGRTKLAWSAVRRPDLVESPYVQWGLEGFVAPGWLHRERWSSRCQQIRLSDWTVWDQDLWDVVTLAKGAYADFDLRPGFAQLAELVTEAGEGARVVLLAVPMTPQLRLMTPGTYGGFMDTLMAFGVEYGVEVLDASELLDDDLDRFKDPYHLNVFGARYLSRWLGRNLGGGL